MKTICLSDVALAEGLTIFDAIDYFYKASRKYDPAGKGFPFVVVKSESKPGPKTAGKVVKTLPKINGKNLKFYDALQLVCDTAGYDFVVKNGVVVVKPR